METKTYKLYAAPAIANGWEIDVNNWEDVKTVLRTIGILTNNIPAMTNAIEWASQLWKLKDHGIVYIAAHLNGVKFSTELREMRDYFLGEYTQAHIHNAVRIKWDGDAISMKIKAHQ